MAARLARRPLLPTGVAKTPERGDLGGEEAFPSAGTAEKRVLAGTSSENVSRKTVRSYIYSAFKKKKKHSMENFKITRFKNH